MPYLMNCTNEEQSVKAVGNYFTFKPGQIKPIVSDDIAHFIVVDKKEHGIVRLPQQFEDDADFKTTPEGKAILEKKKEEGMTHYLDHLRYIAKNLNISIRRDLEMANIKVDPLVYASEGEKKAIRLLAKYAKSGDEKDIAERDELNKILKDADL